MYCRENVHHIEKRHIPHHDTQIGACMCVCLPVRPQPADDTGGCRKHHRRAGDGKTSRTGKDLVCHAFCIFIFFSADILRDQNRTRYRNARTKIQNDILDRRHQIDSRQLFRADLAQPVGICQIVHRLEKAVDHHRNCQREDRLQHIPVQYQISVDFFRCSHTLRLISC